MEQPPSTDNAKERESISGSERPLRLRFPPLGSARLPRATLLENPKQVPAQNHTGSAEGRKLSPSFKQLRVRSFSGKRAPAPPGRGPRRRQFLSREGRRPRRGVSPPGREVQGPLPSLRPPSPPTPALSSPAQDALEARSGPKEEGEERPKMGWEETARTLVPFALAAHLVLHLFPPPCQSAPRGAPRPPRSPAGLNCPEGLAMRRESPRSCGHSPARGSPPVPCGGTPVTPSRSSRSGRAATRRVTRGCPALTHSGDDLRSRPPQPNRAFGRQPAASQS